MTCKLVPRNIPSVDGKGLFQGAKGLKLKGLSCGREKLSAHHTHVFALGLVQHVSFLPLAVGSLVGLADVELHLGALLVLHGLPLVQGHLFGAFIFHLFDLVLSAMPGTHNTVGTRQSSYLYTCPLILRPKGQRQRLTKSPLLHHNSSANANGNAM